MIELADFVEGFRSLGLPASSPVIAHASLSAFGPVAGGASTVLEALLCVFPVFVMPAFTYKTMLIPEIGPHENGIAYGTSRDANLSAQFFTPTMEADRLMGAIGEALRRHPQAHRSSHPILSFSGMNARPFLDNQTISEPLAPIRQLHLAQGWVLLLGVDHTVNTSLHYAERLAGRRQFVRWALTPRGVAECPGFPGCSDGFQAIAPALAQITRQVVIGRGWVQAVPLADLIQIARDWIQADPLALLCDRSYCERCHAVRNQVKKYVQEELQEET
jgi:aminoglycoside 3-N-acetyltransferase